MNWRKTSLGNLMELQRGHDLPDNERVEGNVPVIGSAGINGYHNVAKYRAPGVTIGRSGASIGFAFFVNSDYWPHNACLFVKDFRGNDPKYIYYLLRAIDFERFNSGSAQPSLNRNFLYPIKLKAPPLPIQTKIASILSAYDELIENNNQRIRLLEEMAEEIYKEWFVRLRFPGYENTKMVDGLPEGWGNTQLKKHIKVFRGKSYSSEELREDDNGLPMLNLKNIQRGGGFRRDGLKYFEGKYSENNVAHSGDIIMAVTDMTQNRELVGRVARVPSMNISKFIISMDLVRIAPTLLPTSFLYSFFRYSGIGLKLSEFANGANVLHLTPSLIDLEMARIPTIDLANVFSKFIEPFWNEIDILENKNQLLQQTRDMLLPRLISGKLSVEHLLDEEELALAAEPQTAYGTH